MKTIHAVLLAGTVALLAIPASAQNYGGYSGPPRANPTPATEEVEVTAPRDYYRERRSDIGAPIRTIATQRGVRYDDLDLTTDEDAARLHARVAYTARAMCRELDASQPIAVSGGPSCYREAMDDAMAQADDAIARARGE